MSKLFICAGLTPLLLAISAFAQKSTIEGNAVNANGAPLKNAEVRIQQENSKSAAAVVKTDAKGHFAAAALPAATYNVAVFVDGKLRYSAAHVKVNNGQAVRLALGGKQAPVANAVTQPKKRAVWVPDRTGSRLGGHWEDEPYRGPAGNDVDQMGTEQLRRLQTVPAAPTSTGGR